MSVNFNDDWLITGMRTDVHMTDCDNREISTNTAKATRWIPFIYRSVCLRGRLFCHENNNNMYEIKG